MDASRRERKLLRAESTLRPEGEPADAECLEMLELLWAEPELNPAQFQRVWDYHPQRTATAREGV